MEKLQIALENNPYEIHMEKGLIRGLDPYLEKADQTLIITDENVDRLYGDSLEAGMKGRESQKIILPPGESSKNLSMVEKILSKMLDLGLTRNSRIIALGGGVVGDIAGFCASIYMRGIPYVQVPTTLLAQVDSSVGGKTGVNLPQGKNTVGSFYQPRWVVIDPKVLSTLSKRERITGIGEVIKYGVIYDYDFLTYIRENFEALMNLEETVILAVVKRCCEIKGEIVVEDEKEKGLRKILNFGHTLGHALEALSNYEKYTHGEAVLIGMYHEAFMAKKMGLLDAAYFEEVAGLIKKTGVSLDIEGFPREDLVQRMMRDKKNKGDKISFIVPRERGKVEEKLLLEEVYYIL
ncbi:3-dehydroquinate synthase [Isachenkonia alkalipeptolytica]|uniref:3-dehydroquinate synthase n=1 Tax=Isachenkonia alkalipeptolytica TaxID=2565777 RepID=A0AA44BDZ1_9CLOT|nr:3-dehydroquinate synthase [Isachenkonia alkalipeptolytica]NBG88814.1 3-dehydroquinate synthase [Isachenkonia alkalipeptolytica]